MAYLIFLLIFKAQASDLDTSIFKASKKYGVCPKVMRAVAFLESSSKVSVKPRYNKNGTQDIGVFQINTVHWGTTCQNYDIFTLDGNTLCAAKILSQIEKYKHIDEYYLGRYHSKTPSLKKKYAK